MRSLASARAQGRAERTAVGAPAAGLLARLVAHLQGLDVDVVPVSPELIENGRAEINGEARVIRYNRTLSEAELVNELAHELGHLRLHGRITDASIDADPVIASAYSEVGAAAIARYSPKLREEAEAIAFAREFLCPSDLIFDGWRRDGASTIESLSQTWRVPEDVVRVQLANALHDLAIGNSSASTKTRDVRLTPVQREAAEFTGAPALIDAGPGTGKTATLVARVEHLLSDLDAQPERVLAVTFSNEAAQELAERLADRLGEAVERRLVITTFHGLGMEFLHFHHHLAGFDDEPTLLDDDAQTELLSDMLGALPNDHLLKLYDPWSTAVQLRQHINYCKHHLVSVDDVAKAIDDWPTALADDKEAAREFLGFYGAYEATKREQGRVDFADLILLPLRVLESNDPVADLWRGKYSWVLVDEFQDVSRATSRLLRALCGPANPPWVVGDARQAIYRFLGASPENVSQFQSDFPNARVFRLIVNYRSADPIIAAANALAACMEGGERTGTSHAWTRGSDVTPLGETPVMLMESDSHYGEREAVVAQVREWLDRYGVSLGDIAVLARRHIDVRSVVLGLTEAGLKAQAAGMLTAEGAAGDLAAALTVADAPLASFPRLVFALAGERVSRDQKNAAVTEILRRERAKTPIEYDDLSTEVERARTTSVAHRFDQDAWAALTTFLFSSSRYLRAILDGDDSAERSMQLIEVVSTLSLAVAFRATHAGVQPRAARLRFAESLRYRLAEETVPIPIVPKPRADAVRVMTCHASKGLEFPCVIVASQTVPVQRNDYAWLPPALRPTRDEELEQSDALLFVGVTRAKRAAVVSFPNHAGQGPRARPKKLVQLGESWRETGTVKHTLRPASSTREKTFVTTGPIWGQPEFGALRASALDSHCPIRTYLESGLGLYFTVDETEVYPRFFAALRKALRAIVQGSNSTGQALNADAAFAALDAAWPLRQLEGHPHAQLYYERARAIVVGFIRAYRPPRVGATELDTEIALGGAGDPKVVLDLIAFHRDESGITTAITLRPESFATRQKDGQILWSKLAKRASLVLAEAAAAPTAPMVFSGRDGQMYDFVWSRTKNSVTREVQAMRNQHAALSRAEFAGEPQTYGCDRCPARVTCPHWLGAIAD